jgi:hypothetical protein
MTRNKTQQAMRDGVFSSAFAVDIAGPACLRACLKILPKRRVRPACRQAGHAAHRTPINYELASLSTSLPPLAAGYFMRVISPLT